MLRKLTLLLGLMTVALGAAALSGCFGDAGTSTATPPATTGTAPAVEFSSFVDVTFKEAANSTPINFDTTVFIYDANNDPAAFDGLFM